MTGPPAWKEPVPDRSHANEVRGLVGLVEVGTHVLFGAVLGSYATGEVTLARQVVRHLRPGMLCLADRYFPGYSLWKQATETGADLVWRVRQVIHFPVEERFPDGSFRSWLRLTGSIVNGQLELPQAMVWRSRSTVTSCAGLADTAFAI